MVFIEIPVTFFTMRFVSPCVPYAFTDAIATLLSLPLIVGDDNEKKKEGKNINSVGSGEHDVTLDTHRSVSTN